MNLKNIHRFNYVPSYYRRSINDHAEGLPPWQWDATPESHSSV